MKKYILKDYDRFIAAIWVAIGMTLFMQFAFRSAIIDGALLSLGVIAILYPLTTYLSTTLLQRAMKKRRMGLFVFQFILTLVTLSALISCYILLLDYLGGEEVLPSFSVMDRSDSILSESIGALMTATLVNFGFCGLRFFEQNLKLQKELLESQLQILQAQINPHFMFNVLNHVHVLIRKEPDLADSLLLQYTDILRYQLYNGKKDHITIEQEVRFLKNFIEVETVRWKNKLNIHCTWSVENGQMEFPPLLLITFIENAFKHVSRSDKEKGYINIGFEQKEKTVCLTVENSNSEAGTPHKEDSGIGLLNIRNRLDIVFPDQYRLEINRNDVMYSIKLMINL